MRRAILSASFTMVLLLISAGIGSAATPKKPADHHGYRWGTQKLLCTSVRSERRPNDTVVITYKTKRYWCSRPAKPAIVGTRAQAIDAVRYAYQEKVSPGTGGMYQAFTALDCTGGPTVWRCTFTTQGVDGSATVTFTSSGPKVAFQS